MISLFSEKVDVTFTSSDRNILCVKDYEEIFFDVYEFEINGKKHVAEKQGQYKDCPIVSIPVIINNEKYDAPFVLKKGKFFVLFNTKNTTFLEKVNDELVIDEIELPLFLQEESQEEEIILKDPKDLLNEINTAKRLAREHIHRVQLEKIKQAKKAVIHNKNHLNRVIDSAKAQLLEEFEKVLYENSKIVAKEVTHEKQNIYTAVQNELKKFEHNNKKKLQELDNILNEKVSSLVNALYDTKVNPFIVSLIDIQKQDLHKDSKSLYTQLQNIETAFKTRFEEQAKQHDDLEASLLLANNELNNKFSKSINKALSRIGSVKTDITNIDNKLALKLISLKEDIIKYYDHKIHILENSINDIDTYKRQAIHDLIEESRNKVLAQIKQDSKQLIEKTVVEKFVPKKGAKDLKKDIDNVRKDVINLVNTKFTTEIQALKRLIELSSGGGIGGIPNQLVGDYEITGSITSQTQVIKSSDFNDYVENQTFKSALITGDNSIQTFAIKANPALGTAKFQIICSSTTSRSCAEATVMLVDTNCYINVYSLIHTNNITPLLVTASCTIVDNYLYININTLDECVCVLNGCAIYVDNTTGAPAL